MNVEFLVVDVLFFTFDFFVLNVWVFMLLVFSDYLINIQCVFLSDEHISFENIWEFKHYVKTKQHFPVTPPLRLDPFE